MGYDYSNYDPQGQPFIGSHDLFGSDDLGYPDSFQQQAFMQRSHSGRFSDSTHDSLVDGSGNSQYMQRTNSGFSGGAQQNYLPVSEQLAPNCPAAYHTLSPGYQYSTATPHDYSMYPAAGTTTAANAYMPSTPRNGVMPQYPQAMSFDQLSTMPTASGDTQTSRSPNERGQFVCLHTGCDVKPFARNADLKRHMDHRHGDAARLEKWFCDRKNCPRSEKGYQAMLDRMGRSAGASQSVSSTSGASGGKDIGSGPFFRKDHFKAHLRDIHKEPLWKRDPKSDRQWLDAKIVDADWWRCHKCLQRVYVKKNGWKCACGVTLEADVVDALSRKMSETRQRKIAETSGRHAR